MAFVEEMRDCLKPRTIVITDSKGKKVQRGLTPLERIMLAYLRARQGGNGHCYPSTDTISADLGVTWRHVYRMLKALEEGGLISRKRGAGKLNEYRLTPDLSVSDRTVSPDPSVSKPLTARSVTPDRTATRKEQGRNIEGTSPVEENHFIEACESLQQYWNSKVRGSIPKIKKLTADRIAALRRLSKDDDWKQNYRESILKMAASSFLQGRHDGAWHADFDWWLNLGRNPLAPRGTPNWLKCYEGNYDDEVAS